MNQILYVQKKANETKIDIKKILMFFAISLIVFGVAMMGEGIFAFAKNSNYLTKVQNAVPSATFQRDGQYLIINVTHVKNIQNIEYNWNGDDSIIINGNNQNNITERIELPSGNNTLNVIITDINGKQSRYSKEYSIDTGRDIKKPNIEIEVVGNYLKITATDDTELAYLTYRWNEEEETKVEPTGADNAKIEKNVEIKKGKNTLTLIAVDTSNNTTTEEKTFEGLTKPTLNVYVDGDSFLIIAKHDTAIDHIEYTLNGQKYSIQYTPGPEMQYRQKLVEGYNKIVVEAYSIDKTVEKYEGEYTYTPNQ